MTLNGSLYGSLREALIDAFRSSSKLEQMLQIRLNKSLNRIAMGDDLDDIAFRLIRAADSQGWVHNLVVAARESNPGNPLLFAVAQELHLSSTEPGLVHEKIIRSTNSFLDVNEWRQKLGEIESQVCRIEINRQAVGTGFLIAPNVVITNCHVVKDIILNEEERTSEGILRSASTDIVLRFDFKKLANKIINHGTEYRLAPDWLIDKSSNVIGNRLPTPDELDYTLVRVEGIPGEEAIGKNAESSSALRGWVKLPTKSYEFAPNTPLLIVQHPQAEPLKLAFDTDSIIGVSENGTTVTYRTNTEPGSSGSPCFDINWNLVALHHSGDPNWLNPNYNAGTPLSAIRSRLEKQDLWVDLLSGKPI